MAEVSIATALAFRNSCVDLCRLGSHGHMLQHSMTCLHKKGEGN